MSHICTVKLKVSDLGALEKACKAIGLELKLGKTNYIAHLSHNTECAHAISVVGQKKAYEVGLLAQADGSFELKYDDWAGGNGLMNAIGEKASKLIQEYAATVAEDELTQAGYYNFTREYSDEGELILSAEGQSNAY